MAAKKKPAKKPANKVSPKKAPATKAQAKPAAVPVAERRGVAKKLDYGQYVLLLQSPDGTPADPDKFLDRMIDLGHVGGARRDIAAALFDSEIPRPMGPWGYLVRLVGQPWLYFFGDHLRREWPRELAEKFRLRTLLMGLNGMIGQHEAEAWEGKKLLLDFQGNAVLGVEERKAPNVVMLNKIDGMRLGGERFSIDWLRQFKKVSAAFDAIAREMDAYVPVLDTATTADGHADIEARDGKILMPDAFERIDLVVFGPKETLEPTPGAFALAKAIETGDAAGVRAAIKAGADPRYLPGTDHTPLYQALAWDDDVPPDKQNEVLAALLESGADPNFSPDGEPHIHWAVHWTHTGAGGGDNEFATIPRLRLLLEHGADPNVLGTFLIGDGKTPLHVAVSKGWFNMAKLLLDHGANPKMPDRQGRTAIDYLREEIEKSPDGKWTRAGQSVEGMRKFVEVLEAHVGKTRGAAHAPPTGADDEARRPPS